MKRMWILLLLALLPLALAEASFASVMDFETLMHADDQIASHGAVYEQDGYRLTNTADDDPQFATLGTLDYSFAGSTAIFNDNYLGKTVLTPVSGGVFTLVSMQISEFFDADPFDIVFTGLRPDNSAVFQIFTVDGAFGFQTFRFDNSFAGLVSASWMQTEELFQFDNINAVPEPGTWLLVSGGLLSFALIRRRSAV